MTNLAILKKRPCQPQSVPCHGAVVDATVTLIRTHPLDRPIVAVGAREHPDRETQDSERHSARMQKSSKRAAREYGDGGIMHGVACARAASFIAQTELGGAWTDWTGQPRKIRSQDQKPVENLRNAHGRACTELSGAHLPLTLSKPPQGVCSGLVLNCPSSPLVWSSGFGFGCTVAAQMPHACLLGRPSHSNQHSLPNAES